MGKVEGRDRCKFLLGNSFQSLPRPCITLVAPIREEFRDVSSPRLLMRTENRCSCCAWKKAAMTGPPEFRHACGTAMRSTMG